MIKPLGKDRTSYSRGFFECGSAGIGRSGELGLALGLGVWPGLAAVAIPVVAAEIVFLH